MEYVLLGVLVGGVLYRLARKADDKLSEPARLAARALDYETQQRRQRGMEHGYEWEG